ncbi:MAG: site-2 protease family protein [Candidatus Nanoarchaeia archaeon]|nr:site-2 protease family protein [Candidatus Nanoarchaeia archaeon]
MAVLRTKKGLKKIDYISKKYKRIIKVLGVIGIGVGYVVGIFMILFMFKNTLDMILVPDTPAGVGLVIPGVKVPGTDIRIPLIYGLLGIFVVALIHEFSHGIVSKANNIKILNTGIVFLGPIAGAFVEPDEEQLEKSSFIKKQSILAAGPFSNIILALIVLVLMNFVLTPIIISGMNYDGVVVNSLIENSSAQKINFNTNETIQSITLNEKVYEIKNTNDFSDFASKTRPKDEIIISTDKNEYNLVLDVHPDDQTKGYFGFLGFTNKTSNKFPNILMKILEILYEQLKWIFILSLGIGLANLYPMYITDGAKMLLYSLNYTIKNQKKSYKIFKIVNNLCLFIILFNLIFPLLKGFLF